MLKGHLKKTQHHYIFLMLNNERIFFITKIHTHQPMFSIFLIIDTHVNPNNFNIYSFGKIFIL